ncbi:anthrone oxygenase family protein [Actinomadura gamaensis]|uniref:Anthrone oxygenase family protein n=1 Tax=Actinomadura gamaensis TaxID=1763541 RepID=A0ABV9U5K3_9ACTN
MWMRTLEVLALVGAGTATGILVIGAVALVPCFRALPADRYVEVHQLLDRRIDPLMPILVALSAVLALVLTFAADSTSRSVLFAAGAALLVGVAAVSLSTAVPLLRRHVRQVDASNLPADWYDLRRPWQHWHLVRTLLAVGALFAIASASVAS